MIVALQLCCATTQKIDVKIYKNWWLLKLVTLNIPLVIATSLFSRLLGNILKEFILMKLSNMKEFMENATPTHNLLPAHINASSKLFFKYS